MNFSYILPNLQKVHINLSYKFLHLTNTPKERSRQIIKNQKMQAQAPIQQQKKVESFKVFFHLVSNDQKDLQTHLVDVQKSLTLDECSTILSDKLKKVLNNPQFKLNPTAQPLGKDALINQVIEKDDSDIIVFYEDIKPILKQKLKQLSYESITKYSFLDQKQHVKVYIPLEDIGKVPDGNIHSRFLDRSFQIKINDYKGKNWIFAVPKTQCQVFIKQSKVIKKDNKLIIKLGKIAEGDNWFSLHKTRCVGQKELD